MKRLLAMLSLALLGACAGTRTADLDMGEHSYFVARLPTSSPIAPGRIQFLMARYDPETGRATDWEYDQPSDAGNGRRWHMIAVSPGDYVIMALGVWQGGANWSVCYNESTYRYSIGENEAVFIGDVNATTSMRDLARQVVTEGQARAASGEFSFVHDNISPPQIALQSPSDAAIEEARAALLARHSDAPTTMVWREPVAASFSNAHGIALVSCGG